jgi:hypothetical protein
MAEDREYGKQEAGHAWRPTRQEWVLGCGAVLLAVVLWLVLRPAGEAPWNDRAITANFQGLTIQKPVAPEEAGQTQGDVHVVIRYRLKNGTGKAYPMPEPTHGVLMKSLTGGGWQEVDSVLWDQRMKIPAGKTAEVEFDMAVPSSDEGVSEDPEQGKDVMAAGMARLRSIENLTFFDYERHYVIHLPRGW